MIERFLIILLMAALAPANAEAQAVKAPWPTFLSAEAKGGLAADAARQPEPPTMEERRARADAIQREVGMPRLARHGVAMQDEVIAGVPVRLFTPRNAHAKAPILLNLHGG